MSVYCMLLRYLVYGSCTTEKKSISLNGYYLDCNIDFVYMSCSVRKLVIRAVRITLRFISLRQTFFLLQSHPTMSINPLYELFTLTFHCIAVYHKCHILQNFFSNYPLYKYQLTFRFYVLLSTSYFP